MTTSQGSVPQFIDDKALPVALENLNNFLKVTFH